MNSSLVDKVRFLLDEAIRSDDQRKAMFARMRQAGGGGGGRGGRGGGSGSAKAYGVHKNYDRIASNIGYKNVGAMLSDSTSKGSIFKVTGNRINANHSNPHVKGAYSVATALQAEHGMPITHKLVRDLSKAVAKEGKVPRGRELDILVGGAEETSKEFKAATKKYPNLDREIKKMF